MGFFNDFSEYTVAKCHELNVREAETFWKHIGIWLSAGANKQKANR
ncbi:MAG: hypothetical protein WCC10_12705 [Tumebacillaceae bacterium]